MSGRTPVTPEDWWATAIIDMKPGEIRLRGYPIEDLIGRLSFPAMVWLMTRGEVPSPAQAALLEAAMANAANMLGDVHGGAGEQAVALYHAIAARVDSGAALATAVAEELSALKAAGESHVPGFGHRFHPIDPRAPRLLALVDEAARAGAVSGRFADIGRAVDAHLAATKKKPIPMNIDGATAVVYAELGFAPALCRGLFVLSRSVGALAHAHEEMQAGTRNKGPIPRDRLWTYTGPAPRRWEGG